MLWKHGADFMLYGTPSMVKQAMRWQHISSEPAAEYYNRKGRLIALQVLIPAKLRQRAEQLVKACSN